MKPARVCIPLFAVFFAAAASQPDDWRVARSPHFEVYSQAGDDAAARAMALRLEQLRALVAAHTGIDLDSRPPVRVMAFRSVAEYDPYRVHPSSDAYYLGSEARDYIVMAGDGPEQFGVAAHEYAHVVLRAAGADLPTWLREGLAEVLSTVRISAHGNSIGGDLPLRERVLKHDRRIPLGQLLSATSENGFAGSTAAFYAESWAMADLVLLAPSYAPRFPQFVAALARGVSSANALARIYGKSLGAVEADLQQRRRFPMSVGGAVPASLEIATSAVPPIRTRMFLAEIVTLIGDLPRAESMYRSLQGDAPGDPDVALGFGALALRQGKPDAAREHWKQAIAHGATDAVLCFRYASLANQAGVSPDEIRPALQRAVELKPDFDDARYSLALLESNAGHHEIAVEQLRAMKQIAPARQFGYWTAMADSLTQIGKRAEAKAAALKALDCAADENQRRHAGELAHIAETDLAVRMARDADGKPRMVTTRIPHGTDDFNPFIEPGDAMAHVEGALREVDCGEPVLRIAVEGSEGLVKLAIRGLDRVQIRNGPGEFTCGPQGGVRVAVDYAKAKPGSELAGEVRGLEYK